uniref:Ycf80 n=1 Tax=Ophidocladus simpliciusculus TaxID=1261574 RepID=A0A1Z1MJE2_9FLOR|nr:hypothetical protein [Ophidocladus simpliciusculus]ARW65962.1 hypothetical protein [Ophidocladus simpliciusculus]
MILSNFILFYKVLQNYCKNDQCLTFKLNQKQEKQEIFFNLINLKCINTFSPLISDSKIFTDQFSNEVFEFKHNKDFITRSFWQKLINKYWQETLFISTSNSLSDTYISKVKTSSLSVYKGSAYKRFLSKFSKGLINGSIQLGFSNINNNDISLLTNSNNISIKYIWFKLYNFNIFRSLYSKQYVPQKLNFNTQSINFQTLPLFVLVNDYNELILSESSDQLSQFNIFSKLTHLLRKKLIHSKKSYTGLIFINPEDALEYQESINIKYRNSTRCNKVKSLTSNMHLYYKLLNSTDSNIEFRLIPDLKEISDLLYHYKQYSYISFDASQNYGSNYFQGQPIYLIKSCVIKDKKSSYHELKYTYSYTKNDDVVQYETVFLDYHTAMNAWKNFRKTYKNSNLPRNPKLHVSNLEQFIKAYNDKGYKNKLIFLPSVKTYSITKKYMKSHNCIDSYLTKIIANKVLHIKTVCYRILWSLTSRQPINW